MKKRLKKQLKVNLDVVGRLDELIYVLILMDEILF